MHQARLNRSHTSHRRASIPSVITALALAVSLFVSSFLMIGSASAVTRAEINAMRQQQQELQSQQAELQSQLDSLKKQENAAVNEVLVLEQKISVLQDEIDNTNALIAEYDTQIAEKQVELEAAQAQEEEYYQLFCERVRSMEEAGSVSYWEILFSASSFSDLLDRVSLVKDIMTYDNDIMDQLEAARQAVADAEAALEESRAEQQAALEQLQAQQAEQNAALEESNAALETIRANSATYASQIAQIEAQNDDLSDDIVYAENEYAAQVAAAAAAARQQPSSGGNGTVDNTVVSGNGSAVVQYAMQFVGNPYVWGGTSLTNGADCSGFVMQVYRHFGVSLPHSSAAMRGYGTGVSYENAQPGDILCYSGHVGIYIGGGKMVNALGAKYGICVSSATYKPVITVRRVL